MSQADRIRLRHLVDAADAAAEFFRGVDRDVRWATVQDSLPKLRTTVAAVLEADAGG
jgi:uncharacterized protein with HEPN domain